MGSILRLSCRALTKVVRPAKVYVCSFGEKVKHIHWWIVPRYDYISTHNFDGLSEIVVERKWVCTNTDATHVAQAVKVEFNRLLEQETE